MGNEVQEHHPMDDPKCVLSLRIVPLQGPTPTTGEWEAHLREEVFPLFLVCKWQLYWYTVLCTYRSSETHRRKIKWSLWMSSVVTFLQSSLLCSQYLLNLSISRRCRAMSMLTQIVGVHWIMNRLLLQILPGFCAIH